MLELLLNSTFVKALFIALFFLTPIGAFFVYVIFHKRAKNPGVFVKILILCGLIGPLNLFLWTVYNAIENFFGLDSVVALLINLGIFAVIGLVIGLLMRRCQR